jgi:hypothetical protein
MRPGSLHEDDWRGDVIPDYNTHANLAPNPKNDPALLRPTRCRVLRPFWLHGRAVEPGAVVELQRHDALSLQAIHRVAIL